MSLTQPFLPTNLDEKNYMPPQHDLEELLLMKKKKKDFDYMTSSVLAEQQKNLLASLHFKALYDRLLFLPSIAITLVTGILAVLAQSDRYSERTQSSYTICISVLAAFSVFWQSLVKQLDYGGRAMLHNSAAMALTKIFKLATMRAREQQITKPNGAFKHLAKGLEQSLDGSAHLERAEEGVSVATGGTHQNGGGGGIPEEEGNVALAKPSQVQAVGLEDHFTLSKQFEQALQGCTSVVPIRITAAFDALESRINVCNKRLVPSGNPKPRISWEKVYPALYHQLTLTIIGSKLWPYVVPGAEWVVDKTIVDFKNHDASLFKVLIDRSQAIDEEYNSLATTETASSVSA